MDEKNMAEEFANIYKAIGSNCTDLIDMNKDLKTLAGVQRSFIRHFNKHVDVFNSNVSKSNAMLDRLNRYAKRQNVLLFAGIGGFLYLYKKIQKLEDATKKE